MKHFICICCPKGCHLTVDETQDYAVLGNACPRGSEYGRGEALHPVRTVTATVRLEGSSIGRLPVKTDRPVPKERVFDVIRQLEGLSVPCPVHCGDTLLFRVCGTEAAIVATRTILG